MKQPLTYRSAWQEARAFGWSGLFISLVGMATVAWQGVLTFLSGGVEFTVMMVVGMCVALLGIASMYVGYFQRRFVHHAILFHGAKPDDPLPLVSEEVLEQLKASTPGKADEEGAAS